jgi:ribosomal protein L21E
MSERVLIQLRSLIRKHHYIITSHALEEMSEDDILAEDIESAILTGKIIERQIDRATKERKYVLVGTDCSGESVHVVVKVGPMRKAVVITVYRE